MKAAGRAAALGLFGALSACAAGPPPTADAPQALDVTFPIFSAADALTKRWQRVQVWKTSDWRLAVVGGEIAIEPAVDGSSTALARWVAFDTATCPVAEWTWRVEALPATADLASREAEDMAASVMFIFGDPGSMQNPDPVPTLRYVWATPANPPETVVESPYFPGFLRSVVVRAGGAGPRWVRERRNLREDYLAAFGVLPSESVEAFALYTDNDHNSEAVKAYYRDAKVLCTEAPEGDSIFG